MTTGADEFRVIDLASRLVAIPSVTGSEGAVVAFIARWLESAGLHVQVTRVAPGRPNLLAILPAQDGSTDGELSLLFHAHSDTVAEHGMADPFSGRVEDGQISGRGAVDQKGGLAAAAAALATVARSGKRPSAPVGLAAVIDEESEHRGSMALAQSGLRARQAVVTEPSGLRVVFGCKGTVPLLVTVRGRAAHGCRPWLGVNAVEKGMLVAQKLLGQSFPDTALPGLGKIRGTLNLGVMRGGAAYNIVPDGCELWFDRRTVPGESQAGVLAETQALLDALGRQDPELQVAVEIARPDWHWEPIAKRGLNATLTPTDSELPNWVSGHHEEVVGRPPEWYFTDGYNEMDFLVNDMGIPTVQYGPGDSRLCHTDDERLDINQLLTCCRVYQRMIESS
jgi:acetylornithine deacetylase/succinyl-diaminopimelate desuccinylase-like protein